MEYHIGNIVQFGEFANGKLYIMVGKIEKIEEGIFTIRLAAQTNYRDPNVESVQVPYRMVGNIIPLDRPTDKLSFNLVIESRVGHLAKVVDQIGDYTTGRIVGMTFELDGRFGYVVAISKKCELFDTFIVNEKDEKAKTFIELLPKKKLIKVFSTYIADSRNVTDLQRKDPSVHRQAFMSVLAAKIKELGLVRRVVKTVKTITGMDEDHWYAFTVDNHYIDCSNAFPALMTNPKNPRFLKFEETVPDVLAARPEVGDVVLTREIYTDRETKSPPCNWLLAEDYPGLDVFNTFISTGGKHELFAKNKHPSDVVFHCMQKMSDEPGDRAPTPFSDLLTGYFHKNSQSKAVSDFKSTHVWFLL